MSELDRCIIESKLEQDHNQGIIFNLLATVPTQLQQFQNSCNSERRGCCSIQPQGRTKSGCVACLFEAVVVGGEETVSVVVRKFPKKFRSIYFLKVSRRQVSGCCRPAVKEVIVPQNPFLHLPLLLLRADLKLGPRFCTPLVKL